MATNSGWKSRVSTIERSYSSAFVLAMRASMACSPSVSCSVTAKPPRTRQCMGTPAGATMRTSPSSSGRSSGATISTLKPSSAGVFCTSRQTTWVRLPSRTCGYNSVVVIAEVKPGAFCAASLGRVKRPLSGTGSRVPSGSSTQASTTSRLWLLG